MKTFNKIKKRVITITMDIDEETHKGKIDAFVTENGREKLDYTASEMASTLAAIAQTHQNLSSQFIKQLHEMETKTKSE